MKTKNSCLLTRALSLALCVVMVMCAITACATKNPPAENATSNVVSGSTNENDTGKENVANPDNSETTPENNNQAGGNNTGSSNNNVDKNNNTQNNVGESNTNSGNSNNSGNSDNSDNSNVGGGTANNDAEKPDTDGDEVVEEKDPNELFRGSAVLSADSLIYGTLANEVTIGDDNGGATLPVSVKVANGAQSLDLLVKKTDTGSEIELGEGDTAKSLDVHIAGVAVDNKVPIVVNLGAVLEPGISRTNLKFYHTENDTAVLMTPVSSTDDLAIHNQYAYNEQTGEVSICVATFSVFSAVDTTPSEWDGESVADKDTWYDPNATEYVITSAEEFVLFRDLVDSHINFEGKTVKLAVDIDLMGHQFDPIGFGYESATNQRVFKGVFDGQGHTVYNLAQNGWELDPDKSSYSTYTYSTAGGGLFASIKNATIKNLAVSGANVVFECVDMGIVVGYAQGTCHFENIIVTDSKIANYNRATGAVVGEVCYGPYGTDTSLGYSHTFKNITVDTSVKVSSLWGSFDTLCGGVIGGKWGDATVKMEDVTVACELDVFSDVTSAYRWYAYRRCGMLIGHTEQSSPKKSTEAYAPFLTCENVNVYYGDWVNYNYFEFADQDSGTGQRYPWVRAQAGEHNEAFSNPRYGVPTYGGVKVTDGTRATDRADITFGQLYGGGQGVYGRNNHEGVVISGKLTKTFYIENTENWEDLKLEYWFMCGEDRWTTVSDDGISMDSMLLERNVYKIDLPAFAHGFKISGTGHEGVELLNANVKAGITYTVNGVRITPVVLNAADDTSTVSYPAYQALSAMSVGSVIGHTPTGSYITAKYHGNLDWNDWVTFVFQLAIPDGESIDGATGVAIWADYSQFVGKETWTSEFKTAEGGANVLDISTAYLVDSNGNVSSVQSSNGVDLVGYKGWIIYKIADGADLSGVYTYSFHRNFDGCGRTDAANDGKSVFLDSVTAIMNVDEFIASESARLSASYADVLNDFSDTTGVVGAGDGIPTSTLHVTATTQGLDGKGVKFETKHGASLYMPFAQTDLSQYEAFAFYIEAPTSRYVFTNFKNAAGKNLTNILAADTQMYLLSLDGKVSKINSTENNFYYLDAGVKGYVIVTLPKNLDSAVYDTTGIYLYTSSWHGNSSYAGLDVVVDNLVAVKDMNMFALTFANDSANKQFATLGEPTVEYTGLNKEAANITWTAVEGADNYDVVIYNGLTRKTVNVTETNYAVSLVAGSDLMVQVIAKTGDNVVAVFDDVAIEGNIIGVFNDFTKAGTYTVTSNGTLSTVIDGIGGKGAIVNGLTTSTNLRVYNNYVTPNTLKSVEGVLIYMDCTDLSAINYIRILAVDKNGKTLNVVGESSPTVYVNVIDPETNTVLGRYNWWNAHGIQGQPGKQYYYYVELTPQRVPFGFDFNNIQYFNIQRSPWTDVAAEDIGKSYGVDTLAFVTDTAAFLANPGAYLTQVGINAAYAEDAATPTIVVNGDVATITTGAVAGADKVVVNIYDKTAKLIGSYTAVDGVVTVEGLNGIDFAVQVIGYAADAVVYVGKPTCYNAPCYDILNDFDDINTVVSTFPNTAIVDANDGSALSFDTAKNMKLTFTIPETNFKDYEAIAFYIETGDTPYTFYDIRTAANKALTMGYMSKGEKARVTNYYYVDIEAKTVTTIMGPHWENGYFNIPANAKGYVIAIINKSGYRIALDKNCKIVVDSATPVTDADFITDKLVITATQWHDSSPAAHNGKTLVIDDLMVIKSVEDFIDDLGITTHTHIYTEILTDVTVQDCATGTEGSHTSVCYCGAKLNYTVTSNHAYATEVIPATPESQGYTKHTCSACGDTYNDTFVDYVPE